MKKNNTAEKTVQEAKELTEALKESTKKSFKEIMKEAIDNIISDEDDDEVDDTDIDTENSDLGNDIDAEDVETDETPEVSDEEEPVEGEGEEAPAEGEADDEWSDMEQFKVGDNDYDFTSLDGEDKENQDDIILKVFNKLGDDDQIFVKKDEDGNYEVKDEETGAEYVIELDADAEEAEPEEGDAEGDDIEIELDDDTEGEPEGDEEGDDDIEIELQGDEDEEPEKELDEEKQEFTDSYQKQSALDGPGMNVNEPADKSATNTWDKVPTGKERPYGNPGEGDPFNKTVNECGPSAAPTAEPTEQIDEAGNANSKVTSRTMSKTVRHKDKVIQGVHNDSENGEFKALKESARKIYNKAKQIQEENKRYKGYIEEIKKSLTEAAVLNVSLTQALKLVVENATTADEKKSILKRFNNVQTLQESKKLYETIKNELKESKKSEPLLERTLSAAPSKTLNETTIYDKKNNPSLDLMTRMDNLWK